MKERHRIDIPTDANAVDVKMNMSQVQVSMPSVLHVVRSPITR